jgi:phosphohistidine phosphatase SixA
MRLLLIRHADAGSRDPARWADDTQRPITDRGRRRHRRVARRLRRRRLVPTLHFASPWLRAWQTAELTAEVAGGAVPVVMPALAAPPDLAALAAGIGAPGAQAIVALVGHEPWLSHLASLLLAGDPTDVSIDFPKSGVLGLGCDAVAPGRATLEFFWRPKGS